MNKNLCDSCLKTPDICGTTLSPGASKGEPVTWCNNRELEPVELTTAWFEGDEAGKQGHSRDANPYHSDPDNSKLWDMGYHGITGQDMINE